MRAFGRFRSLMDLGIERGCGLQELDMDYEAVRVGSCFDLLLDECDTC